MFATDLIHILVLNSWYIDLFKQLVTAQLVRKFSTFYSTQRFVTVHNIQSLPPILRWMNLVQSLSSYFLKIQLNLILLSMPKSCKLLFHRGFPTTTLFISLLWRPMVILKFSPQGFFPSQRETYFELRV